MASSWQVGGDGLDDDVVDPAGKDAGALGGREVARHGGVGDEELGVVRAGAVAAVLLFVFEHADDGVGIAGDHEGLADDGLAGVELAVGVGAEEDDAARRWSSSSCGEEAALLDLEGAEAAGTAGQTPRTARLAAFHWLTSETVRRSSGETVLTSGASLLDGDGVVDGEA